MRELTKNTLLVIAAVLIITVVISINDADASHKKKPTQSAPALQSTVDLSNYVDKTTYTNDITKLQDQITQLQTQVGDLQSKLGKAKDAPENRDK